LTASAARSLTASTLFPAADGPLMTCRTRHFRFIYPRKLRTAVFRLAERADAVFERLRRRFPLYAGPEVLPVCVTAAGSPNGYYAAYPRAHIVIYAAPARQDGALGNLRSTTYNIFVHELTHAVTLNMRHPHDRLIAAVIGDGYAPQLLIMPAQQIEGVSQFWEDRRGGRSHDPIIRGSLRNDLARGRFLTLEQTYGLYTRYPQGAAYYRYGAQFTAFLIRRYGEKRYEQLWRRSCDGLGAWGFSPLCRAVYGKTAHDLWREFKQSLALPSAGENDPPQRIHLPGKTTLRATAAQGSDLYIYDEESGRLLKRSLDRPGPASTVFSLRGLNALSIRPDNTQIALSWTAPSADVHRSYTALLNPATKRLRPVWQGVRGPAYSPDGKTIAAVRLRRGNADIILLTPRRRTLLRGHPGLRPGTPCFLSSTELLFTAATPDTHHLLRIHLATGDFREIVLPEGFSHPRFLRRSNGAVMLGVADRQDRYRCALLEKDELTVFPRGTAGGLYHPVRSSGRIIAVARGPETDRLISFPAKGGKTYPLTTRDFSPAPARAAPQRKETPYVPAADVPFQAAFFPAAGPLFGIRENGIESIGGAVYAADPAEVNRLTAAVLYHRRLSAVNWLAHYTRQTRSPLTFYLRLNDSFEYSGHNTDYRLLFINGGFSLYGFDRVAHHLMSLYLSASYALIGLGPGASPYGWPLVPNPVRLHLQLQWDGTHTRRRHLADRAGHRLHLAVDYTPDREAVTARPVWTWAWGPLPLRLDLQAALSNRRQLVLPGRDPVYRTSRQIDFPEYAGQGEPSYGRLLGRLRITPLTVPLEWKVPLLPLYLSRFNLNGGGRAAWLTGPVYSTLLLGSDWTAGLHAGNIGQLLGLYTVRLEGFYAAAIRQYGWRITLQPWRGFN